MADPRLDPANAHPLNASDCLRSQARVSDIELGLRADVDGWNYWRDKAQARVRALEDDGNRFGLAPHEEAELEILKGLLAKVNERLAK